MKLSVGHRFQPKQRSLRASQVQDFFGIGFEEDDYKIAENWELQLQPGELVLLTGPSGSGKTSLMRAIGNHLRSLENTHVVDSDAIPLGNEILVDAWDCPLEETLKLLSACGLGEARLLLRTPRELSEGQRYRFRLATAFQQQPSWICADEFTATLDRTLARVVAFNLHRLARRRRVGLLLATTHEDITTDLHPTLHIQCDLQGRIEVQRQTPRAAATRISFFDELSIHEGSAADWPRFAAWHYRSHRLGFVRQVFVLKHHAEPIGICVMTAPARSLRLRNRFFGTRGHWSRVELQALNMQLVTLSRVVVHPTYRGAGVSSWFIRECCRRCKWPWIEALAQMGHLNPFFEKAGFQRIGVTNTSTRSLVAHAALYGGGRNTHGRSEAITRETHEKSRFAQPVYYIYDNRRSQKEEGRA